MWLQEEQQKASADQAVVPKEEEDAKKDGGKPRVISKDGDTIYIGFGKGSEPHLASALVQLQGWMCIK